MQPIESMFRRTSHRVTRQRDLFALRAKKAGNTFSNETRQASRELASAVKAEAGAWGSYIQQSTQKVTSVIAPKALERTFLVRASVVLHTLEQRVKQRIAKLDGSWRSGGARRTRVRVSKVKKQLGNGVAHISGAVTTTRRKASASRGRDRAS